MNDLAAARKLTNARTSGPVTRLPSELLCVIFKMLRDDIHARGGVSGFNNRLWAPVTQVSRMWRSVSLECAPLWDVLYLGHDALNIDFGTMLSRSKDVPLTIIVSANVDGNDNDNLHEAVEAFDCAIEHHSYRLRALEIYCDILPLFTDTLLTPRTFPILKSIQCTNTGGRMELNLLCKDSALWFPSLTTLSLYNVTLRCFRIDSQTPALFSNLVDFHLIADEDSRDQDSYILSLIGTMPALQTLVIKGAFPFIVATGAQKAITLPQSLTFIALRWDYASTFDSCVAFLRKLRCTNPSARASLFAFPYSAPSLIHQYFGFAQPPKNVLISIKSAEHAWISTKRQHPAADGPAEIRLHIEFDDKYQIDDSPAAGTDLLQICARIHRDQLTAVTVTSNSDTDDLTHVFENIWELMSGPAVTTVHAIGRASACALLSVLTDCKCEYAYENVMVLTLALDESEAEEPRQLPQDSIFDLMDYVSERKLQGAPVRQVRLWPGALDEEELSDLGRFVDDVRVEAELS